MLSLGAGTYFFESLSVQPGAQLVLSGVVVVYVHSSMTFHGSVVASVGGAPQLLLGYFGSQSLVVDAAFSGTLIAPNAPVTLADSAVFRGVLLAHDIAIQPSATIAFVPLTSFP
jgi:hypothetical protein